MSLLVTDCPRCDTEAITFDVSAAVLVGRDYSWLAKYEVFCTCRHCRRPTIFLIHSSLRGRDYNSDISEKLSHDISSLINFKESLNPYFEVIRYISLRDHATSQPPDHLPDAVKAAFDEGAACLSIGCYNAASCMFRLCLDLVSKPLLPTSAETNTTQPNDFQRRNLGPRLKWLFDQSRLPSDLRGLAECVKDDGNDGAHAGSLSKADAEDLLDFTTAFLARLISEPKKIEAAKARQNARRQSTP